LTAQCSDRSNLFGHELQEWPASREIRSQALPDTQRLGNGVERATVKGSPLLRSIKYGAEI
jgi:hypothetical protein